MSIARKFPAQDVAGRHERVPGWNCTPCRSGMSRCRSAMASPSRSRAVAISTSGERPPMAASGVAPGLERVGETVEQGIRADAVDRADLAVHEAPRALDPPAVGLADALVAEADAEDGLRPAQRPESAVEISRVSRCARSGRDDDAAGTHRLQFSHETASWRSVPQRRLAQLARGM